MDFIEAVYADNGKVYLVGGYVRDLLFNSYHNYKKKINDIDLVIEGLTVGEIVVILEKYGTINGINEKYGTMVFCCDNMCFDVSVPRKEISCGINYSDFDIDINVAYTIVDDMERRDASINSIAIKIYSKIDIFKKYDICNENIIDIYGGINDIINKKWRMIGIPNVRFEEDIIRAYRCVRQCNEMDISIDKNTKKGIINGMKLINSVNNGNVQKINCEIEKIFLHTMNAGMIDFCFGTINIMSIYNLQTSHIPRNVLYEMFKKVNKLNIIIGLLLHYNKNIDVKEKIQTIKSINKKDILFFKMIDNINHIKNIHNSVSMRKFIVMNNGKQNTKKLLMLDSLINGDNEKVLNLYKKNKNVIISVCMVNLNGKLLLERLKSLSIQIDNRVIGKIKKIIFDKIIEEVIINDQDIIINYIINKKIYLS